MNVKNGNFQKNGNFRTDTECVWRGHLVLAPFRQPQWRVSPGGGGPGDRVMAITIRAPRGLWDLPSMTAEISIGESQAPNVHIDASAVAEALRPVLGAEVHITVHEHEEDEQQEIHDEG